MNMKLLFILLLFSTTLSAQNKYWITFTDKSSSVSKSELQKVFTDAVLTKKEQNGLDWYDYPVDKKYISKIKSLGISIHNESRYFNSITVTATENEIEQIRELSFVKEIKPVVRLKRTEPTILADDVRQFSKVQKTTVLDYGNSAAQNSLTKLSSLHNLGINGRGISVGLIDEGTKTIDHEAFSALKLIQQKNFVTPPPGKPANTFTHGTATLSLMGAYMPGKLIGGTFESSFYLAETEYSPVTDYAFEEDNLVSAIEWMESQGVDVINVSLGYLDFLDKTSYSYGNGDLNGQTALCTKAADIAAKKGVAVFVAMGNEGNTIGVTGSLSPPSDGFNVFSSGAVNSNGFLGSFSSRGPTNDGRIKPDGVSMGVQCYVALPASSKLPNGGYEFGNGTSYASPLSASAGALILSVYPELKTPELNSALRLTADKANNPNKDYGWGLIDAEKALYSIGPAVSNQFSITYSGSDLTISGVIKWDETISLTETKMICYRPTGDSVILSNPLLDGNTFSFSGNISANMNDTLYYRIEGKTVSNKPFNYPLRKEFMRRFVYGQPTTFEEQLRRNGNHSRNIFTDTTEHKPLTFSISPAYPNPFNPETQIKIVSLSQTAFIFEVFNLLGQNIYTSSGTFDQGENILRWNPGYANSSVSSGIYFLKITVNNQTKILKATLLK